MSVVTMYAPIIVGLVLLAVFSIHCVIEDVEDISFNLRHGKSIHGFGFLARTIHKHINKYTI